MCKHEMVFRAASVTRQYGRVKLCMKCRRFMKHGISGERYIIISNLPMKEGSFEQFVKWRKQNGISEEIRNV